MGPQGGLIKEEEEEEENTSIFHQNENLIYKTINAKANLIIIATNRVFLREIFWRIHLAFRMIQ
jgi:hypothetical protein